MEIVDEKRKQQSPLTFAHNGLEESLNDWCDIYTVSYCVIESENGKELHLRYVDWAADVGGMKNVEVGNRGEIGDCTVEAMIYGHLAFDWVVECHSAFGFDCDLLFDEEEKQLENVIGIVIVASVE